MTELPDAAMDVKQPRSMSPIRATCPSRRSRPLLSLLLAAAGLCYLYYVHSLSQLASDRWRGKALHSHPIQPATAKVPLEAHIMSKCPDARVCRPRYWALGVL